MTATLFSNAWLRTSTVTMHPSERRTVLPVMVAAIAAAHSPTVHLSVHRICPGARGARSVYVHHSYKCFLKSIMITNDRAVCNWSRRYFLFRRKPLSLKLVRPRYQLNIYTFVCAPCVYVRQYNKQLRYRSRLVAQAS